MTKPKTVESHLESCEQVEILISDANALVLKLKHSLETARRTLEQLKDYQHPRLSMSVPYSLGGKRGDTPETPAQVITLQIEEINKLLGDRA